MNWTRVLRYSWVETLFSESTRKANFKDIARGCSLPHSLPHTCPFLASNGSRPVWVCFNFFLCVRQDGHSQRFWYTTVVGREESLNIHISTWENSLTISDWAVCSFFRILCGQGYQYPKWLIVVGWIPGISECATILSKTDWISKMWLRFSWWGSYLVLVY